MYCCLRLICTPRDWLWWMEDRETPRMHKYWASKTTRIMMSNVRHVTASAGRPIYQADGFFFDGVYLPLFRSFSGDSKTFHKSLCNIVWFIRAIGNLPWIMTWAAVSTSSICWVSCRTANSNFLTAIYTELWLCIVKFSHGFYAYHVDGPHKTCGVFES